MKATKSARVIALFSLLVNLTSTAHAALEYDEYIERAQKARARGDWQDAATNYAEAINHPTGRRKPPSGANSTWTMAARWVCSASMRKP